MSEKKDADRAPLGVFAAVKLLVGFWLAAAVMGILGVVLLAYIRDTFQVETEHCYAVVALLTVGVVIGSLIHDQIEKDRQIKKDKAVVLTDLGVNPGWAMLLTVLAVGGFIITLTWSGMEASGQIRHGDPQPPYPEVIVLKK